MEFWVSAQITNWRAMLKLNNRIMLAVLWLILSVSLSSWWFILALRQASMIAELRNSLNANTDISSLKTLQRQNLMIKGEGLFFIFLLSIGGLTLIIMSYRDSKRNQLMKDFFSTLTHEMKTPLASLRLQAESLEEDLGDSPHSVIVKRLIEDSSRLELQMDRALYLASITRSEILYIEKVNLKEIIIQLFHPSLKISINAPDNIMTLADKRALESIFKNLLENSVNRGLATIMEIEAKIDSGYAELTFRDNGTGFSGDPSRLGKPFIKHTTKSGSGIGLYLAKKLIAKMSGRVSFRNTGKGFEVKLLLPVYK